MCIICIVKRGAKPPKEDMLIKMAEANPDLSGLAWEDHQARKIRFLRGVSGEEAISKLLELPKNTIRLLHFRIATSGKVDTLNAHPFPLGRSYGTKEGMCRRALAHNGIMGKGEGDRSDTHLLAKALEQLTPTLGHKLLEWLSASGNRFALISYGQIRTYGKFIKIQDGVWVSNLSYMKLPQPKLGSRPIIHLPDRSFVVPGLEPGMEEQGERLGVCRICHARLFMEEWEDGICEFCRTRRSGR